MSSGSRWRWRPTNFPSLQALVIILSCLACLPHNTVARDGVTADEPLKDGDTLVSSGETFELGFFRPGRYSNLTFLGIWYKHVQAADRTVVWVANRDSPLMDSSGVLQIGNQGNVVLVNGSGGVVWSSNMTTARRPVLQLLDTGNLVVVRDHDQITNGEEVEGVMKQDQAEYLWQSFDYPSDTLLPGMKLGWDMRIGLERKLTSWRSSDDPSPGGYTFAIEPHGLPQAYLLHGTTLKYRSGPWNGLRFSGVPEMKSKEMFDFRFVAGADEVYYSYDVIDRTLLSRLKVTHDGVLKRLTWVEQSKSWNLFWSAPKDQCDEYAVCGPYGMCNTDDSPVCECPPGFEPKSQEKWNLRDGSDGCVRSTLLMTTEECGGGGSSFVRLTGMKLPETKGALVERRARGLGECEAACRRNCSCMGYAPADVRGGGSGCVWWDGDLVDIRAYDADGGQDMYLRVPASVLGTYVY